MNTVNSREAPAIELPVVAHYPASRVYALPDGRQMEVASDALTTEGMTSAATIPNKGRAVTALSSFWHDNLSDIVPTTKLPNFEAELPGSIWHPYLEGRTLVMQSTELLPVRCSVTGYLSGESWQAYRQSGEVQGRELPAGLKEASPLPEPLFSAVIDGEEPAAITMATLTDRLGRDMASELESLSLRIYARMHDVAAEADIIIADTRLSFGILGGSVLALCNQAGTPDTSQFRALGRAVAGTEPPSYTHQPLERYLQEIGWTDKTSLPEVPQEVTMTMAVQYQKAYERISGRYLVHRHGHHAQLGGYAVLLSRRYDNIDTT